MVRSFSTSANLLSMYALLDLAASTLRLAASSSAIRASLREGEGEGRDEMKCEEVVGGGVRTSHPAASANPQSVEVVTSTEPATGPASKGHTGMTSSPRPLAPPLT